MGFFPVYEPSAERVSAIETAFSEAANPLNVHFDAGAEVRAKGAGFYQFAADEGTRAAQMEELKAAREETERARREAGAEDVKVGTEGMHAGEGEAKTEKSRAMEKRKREMEERRQMLNAKRRKVGAGKSSAGERVAKPEPLSPPVSKVGEDTPKAGSPTSSAPPMGAAPVEATMAAAADSTDPFAMLESRAKTGKGKEPAPDMDADTFLASIEDVMKQSAK